MTIPQRQAAVMLGMDHVLVQGRHISSRRTKVQPQALFVQKGISVSVTCMEISSLPEASLFIPFI